jgi:carbamoyl-phosphate synthase large subunit
MSNLVLIGGAKRVTLAEKLLSISPDLNIYSLEKDDGFYPISSLGTVVSAPKFNTPEFDSFLHNFLISHQATPIGCMDACLTSISKLRGLNFGGGIVIGHTEEGSNICLNKELTAIFCKTRDVLHPRSFAHVPLNTKLIAKPKQGFGSKGIVILNTADRDLINELENTHVIQEFIDGPETTHDLYINKYGGYISSSRDRINVVDGEVEHCIVRKPTPEESKIFESVIESHLFWGPLTIQTIKNAEGKVYLIEINARLGGGVTASIEANVPIIENFLHESLGKIFPNKTFKPLEMRRALRDFYRFL